MLGFEDFFRVHPTSIVELNVARLREILSDWGVRASCDAGLGTTIPVFAVQFSPWKTVKEEKSAMHSSR